MVTQLMTLMTQLMTLMTQLITLMTQLILFKKDVAKCLNFFFGSYLISFPCLSLPHHLRMLPSPNAFILWKCLTSSVFFEIF